MNKRIISLYLEEETIKKLDAIAVETGRARGVVINNILSAMAESTMIKYARKRKIAVHKEEKNNGN